MDIIQQYIFDNTLSGERILSEVDEWTLYCFYLGYEPELRRAYSSPLDVDNSPSFSVFESNNAYYDYLWKDNGKRMISGAIFKLIKLMYGYKSYDEVYSRIAVDFEIDIACSAVDKPKIIDKSRPVSKPRTKIRIKSKPFSKEGLEFWRTFGVSEILLDWKQVKEVDFVWYNDEQQFPYKCKNLTFAYPEWNLKYKEWRYQIYSPFDKEFKFRNDLEANQIYGWNHLPLKGDLCVITKSNKDILCLKKFKVSSVSPRSETTIIKPKVIVQLKERFKRVVTLYDNDEAGIKGAEVYDLEHLIIPVESKCKDFSDFIKMYGERDAEQLLRGYDFI